MKRYLLIICITLAFSNYGFCQDGASLLNKTEKPNLYDSLGYYKKVQYFEIITAEKETSILSVDQNQVQSLYGTNYSSVKYRYLKIPVKLTNRSADTLKYIGMSCSWWDIYRTDNENIRIFPINTCFKNSPVNYTVMPYQDVIANIIVVFPRKLSRVQSFKIAMVMKRVVNFKQKKNIRADDITLSTPLMSNMVWSNDILIPVIFNH